MKERLFKCLRKGKVGPYSNFMWPRIGVWVEAKGKLSVCENGIHLCREKDLVVWLNDEIYEAEYDGGERIDSDNKIVVRRARLTKKLKTWNDKKARLLVCDYIERILPIFEKIYPDDKRPRQAIETARKYAKGKATRQELDVAAEAADAAVCAAYAAHAAYAADAAYAAYAAARAAYAARVATHVAHAAEREWQTKRLMEYLYPRKKG